MDDCRVEIKNDNLFFEGSDDIYPLNEYTITEFYDLFIYLQTIYRRDVLIQAYKLLEKWLYGKIRNLYYLFVRENYFDIVENENLGLFERWELETQTLFFNNCNLIVMFAERHPGQVNHFWTRLDLTIQRTLIEISRLIL